MRAFNDVHTRYSNDTTRAYGMARLTECRIFFILSFFSPTLFTATSMRLSCVYCSVVRR